MTPAQSEVQIWGILPAAGMSRRMGRPKLTLPHENTTIAGSVARTLLDAGAGEAGLTRCAGGLVVVTRTELIDDLELPTDSRLHVVINDDAESEMIDSVRMGLRWIAVHLAETAERSAVPVGVLVVPADMPTISAEVCRQCMAAFLDDAQRIVIARHAGQGGHPIVFPLSLRDVVDQLDGGLRELPRTCSERVFFVETGEPGVVHDVDTPGDYQQL